VVITDRKLADPDKAALLRLGRRDVSAMVAPDGVRGRWQPHRPAGGLQPKIGAGGSEPVSGDRAAEWANACRADPKIRPAAGSFWADAHVSGPWVSFLADARLRSLGFFLG
jgi:hypothetical protein